VGWNRCEITYSCQVIRASEKLSGYRWRENTVHGEDIKLCCTAVNNTVLLYVMLILNSNATQINKYSSVENVSTQLKEIYNIVQVVFRYFVTMHFETLCMRTYSHACMYIYIYTHYTHIHIHEDPYRSSVVTQTNN